MKDRLLCEAVLMPRSTNGFARDPVILAIPLRGYARVQNSPADRVPSHGTSAFGSSHAIDLVPVDEKGRSAPRTWRGLLTHEPPDIFVGFGRPVLAPVTGTVELVHDQEPDHEARRSQLALVPYMLGQPRRAQLGAPGLAGNHVVIAIGSNGPFVLLAHLQHGSVQVRPGQPVSAGEPVARCGNSGNSTEPHLHLQVSDSTQWTSARGLPFAFRREDEVPRVLRLGTRERRTGPQLAHPPDPTFSAASRTISGEASWPMTNSTSFCHG